MKDNDDDGSPVKPGLKTPPNRSPTPPSPVARFRHGLGPQNGGFTPSPVKTFKAPRARTDDSSSGSEEKAPRRGKGTRLRRRGPSQRDSSIQADSGQMSQAAVFKMPGGGSSPILDPTGTEADAFSSGLSSPEDDYGEHGRELIPNQGLVRTPAHLPTCPLCDEPLDSVVLKANPLRSGMNFDQQMKFCLAHKKISARAEWNSKGYPEIKWQRLDLRMSCLHPYMQMVLRGKKSPFRDSLEEDIAAGTSRTLKKTESRLVPGYYGPRGLRAMSEYIIGEFSAVLRSRSVEDKTISARGPTTFVYRVMVPELAVQLIREDMGVGAEDARVIMRESMALGTLLNEEIADVVLKDKDTEDEDTENEHMEKEGSNSISELSEVESIGL